MQLSKHKQRTTHQHCKFPTIITSYKNPWLPIQKEIKGGINFFLLQNGHGQMKTSQKVLGTVWIHQPKP